MRVSFSKFYRIDYAFNYYCAVADAPYEYLDALTATESRGFSTTILGISSANVADPTDSSRGKKLYNQYPSNGFPVM